jgi:hypothetical protein
MPQRRGPDEITEPFDVGQIDRTTTPTLTETSMIEVRIHSCLDR